MELQEANLDFVFNQGFYPNQSDIGPNTIPGTWRDGNAVWQSGEGWYSDRGVSSGGGTGGAASLTALESTYAGMSGSGNVISAFGTRWFAGSGNALVTGSSIGASAGTLMLIVAGSAVAAGLTAPSAPTVTDSGVAASSAFRGSRSIALGGYRSTDGHLSSRSAPSAVITTDGKKVRITWSSVPTGVTHWVIYATPTGQGSTGNLKRLNKYALTALPTATYSPAGTTTLDIEYFDSELGEQAPIDFDPPPASVTHCALVGQSMVCLTANGLIYPSYLRFPEAFPPKYVTNLPVRQTVTGINVSIDGVHVISTAGSLCALLASGNDFTPVLARGIWDHFGFAWQNGWCIHQNDIYGMAGRIGPVRTQGLSGPDSSFAIPVLSYFRENSFTAANTVVVASPANGAILWASGTKMVAYMVATGRWSGPFTLSGTAQAGVTVGEVGYIAIASTLTSLDSAGAGGAYFLQSPYFGARGHMLTLIDARFEGPDSCVVDYFDYRTKATIGGIFPYSFTQPDAGVGPNRDATGLSLKVSGTGGGKTFSYASAACTVSPLRRAA
jgi:hypothetical protein